MQVNDKKISSYYINGTLDIEMIMDDYHNYIYAIIKRICVNLSEDDIEEIYLEVFFALWQNQSKLDINKPILAYLIGITKNLAIHKLKESNKINEVLECEENYIANFDIELTLIWQEKEKIISKVLEKLKLRDKEIFILYYYQGKNVNEISKLYNLSSSNVKIILFRIRKLIKKALIKGGYDYNV